MSFNGIVDFLNGIIWSSWLIWLCLGTGIFFSIIMKFPQVRLIKDMVTQLFSGGDSESGVSSFQSFAMALGGRVGTGNIAGVASAIGFGGPGAVFWMWAIAFLGAGSAYIESALAQVYKEKMDGEYRGGPSYYIEKGLGQRWYAVLFALSAIVACGFFLPGIQANSIAVAMNTAFNIPVAITGAIVAALLGLIIFGGVKRIGKAAEVIVPFMAIAYIIVAVIIIVLNFDKIPGVFSLIWTHAWSAKAATGAVIGQAIMWGVKRGIYSNEAGQGTGPMAAAAAEVSHPAKQGLVQAFSVYVDTLFVCSATAFMILITGMYNIYDTAGNILVENIAGVEPGPAFTQMALDSFIPGFGSSFIAIALFFFAFTTLMAYYYYAESNVAYIARNFKNHKLVFNLTRVALLVMTFVGSINSAGAVWALGDIGVGLMAWLNIVAILLLTKVGVATLKDYESQKKLGLDPVFNPEALGIKNADFWMDKLSKPSKTKIEKTS
ncbi:MULTISPECIES: sodium:alanine symporter family protein [unclassified Fusibacter]|uniref:alanine/glycine:cation symporter family protein n=1 Tax=unclassified Fusibacter TaxID=2624464 RepID=UPI001011168F|nr:MULTISPECIES: alanine/glycine:cation symporter family protein [unclassified Fusibacter]MCK8059101.1 alanine:cation symporter family protein [Fusibacter sp. A2]NPE22510.1 alanine:cation symporter family protein [Fusibacter sp. A1]RXV60613.1 alanine:cation symporter family protein [Fusibacter sp. A1]